MIENVRLDGLELLPLLVGDKEVDLYRQSAFADFPLGGEKVQMLGYDRMSLQIPYDLDSI